MLNIISVEYKIVDNVKIKVTTGISPGGTKLIIEEPEHTEEEKIRLFEKMLYSVGYRILGYDPDSVERFEIT